MWGPWEDGHLVSDTIKVCCVGGQGENILLIVIGAKVGLVQSALIIGIAWEETPYIPMHCNNCEMVFPEICMLKPSQSVTSFAKLWILPEVCRSAQIGVMEIIKLGKVRRDLYCLSSDQKSSQGREEKQRGFFCFVFFATLQQHLFFFSPLSELQ